jgi:metal-sulfur cluster biosynthetic enzyme
MTTIETTAVDRTLVETTLNQIIDPCSAAAGCPAGLVEMGLVRQVSIDPNDDGLRIEVTLAVTHPFCMMSAVFVNEARLQLAELAGVSAVHINLDTSIIWTDADFTPAYAERRNASLRERGLIPVSDLYRLDEAATPEEHSHD